MTIRLYHAPLACSLASRLALIEAAVPYELKLVFMTRDEQSAPEYLAVNPRGKVPALQVDGEVITESSAILPYVAGLAPASGLMPSEAVARAKAQAMLSYLSSTHHAAWTCVIRPERFTLTEDTKPVREAALTRLGDSLSYLEAEMTGREYLFGRLTVCDLYLATFLAWRGNPVVRGRLPATPHLDAFQGRVFDRPELGAALRQDIAWRREG